MHEGKPTACVSLKKTEKASCQMIRITGEAYTLVSLDEYLGEVVGAPAKSKLSLWKT